MKKYFPILAFPISVYLIWRSVVLTFQIFLQPNYKITESSETLYQRIYLSWVSYWDVGHYTGIALRGYEYPQQAFFPLWPLVIKTVYLTGIPIYPTVIFLTFLFGLTTFILFYLLASKLIGKPYAKLALILFCCFPSTMFLLAGYTEGLFLTLTLLSFLLIEKKQYFLGSLAGGLASLTRLAGIGIAFAFLNIKQPLTQKFKYFLICALGVGLYMLYLQLAFGDAFYFAKAQQAWCEVSNRCQLTFPLQPIFEYGELLITGVAIPGFYYDFYDWVSSVIFLSLLIVVYRKLNLNYFIYSLIILIFPLFSGSTASIVRYVLVAFPIFFVFPLFLRNKFLFFVLCALLFLLQLRFITFFTSREWVA